MSKKKFLIPSTFFLCTLLALSTLALVSFAVVFIIWASAASHSASPQQYLALGDSLVYGLEVDKNPKGTSTGGYAQDLFQTLQAKHQNFDKLANLGCSGETSTSFIHGDKNINGNPFCPKPQVGDFPQLSAALIDLKQNADKTGLVTLQIGVNDILHLANPFESCAAADSGKLNATLNTLDSNVQSILTQLHAALKDDYTHHTRLVLVNYYNVYQKVCPNGTSLFQQFQQFDDHLQKDATKSQATTVDIAHSFNQNNACQLIPICNTSAPNIHPTAEGYQVIASDIYQQVFDHGAKG